MGFLDMPNSAKVNKGAYTIFVDDYAGAGDGTAAGTAALQKAFTDAQGKTLVLGKQKTYTVSSMITAPKDMTLVANGSKFLKNTIGSWAFLTDNGFRADLLWIETPGHATTSDQGAFINGNDVHIRHLKVVSTQGDTPGLNGAYIGASSGAAKTNVRIDRLEVTGWQRPVRLVNLADSCIANIDIRNFIVGVYLQNNVSNVSFPRATITGTSASATGINGQNGLLIEGTVTYNTQGLKFYDWTIDGAPEHSFRIGGSASIRDVSYINCMSRNSGNAAGNASTGGGGFKAVGGDAYYHDNIRYINCTVEDINTDAAGINNFTGFSFGYCKDMVLENPVVKARNKTYSCQNAVFLNAVDNVSIVNPDFMAAKQYGVFVGKDSTNTTLAPVTNCRVRGGRIGSAINYAIYFATQDTATRNVSFDDVDLVGNTTTPKAMRSEAVSGAGVYERVRLKVRYNNVATVGSEPPLLTQAGFRIEYEGPVYGYSMAAVDGSRYVNTDTGIVYLRKAGAWAAI